MRVADVLVCAAAATTEVRAARLNAMCRWLCNFDQVGLRKLFLVANNPGGDAFAVDRERNEDGFALVSPNAAAAKRDVVDLKFDDGRQYCRT